jgi:DNA-binding beta-propeller fold protein YncE
MRLVVGLLLAAGVARPAGAQSTYYAYVGAEGNDQVALVRFGPDGAKVDHLSTVGSNPAELVGPHGLVVSPDGRYYYVSTAHGTPAGALWKFTTTGDSLVGRVELGLFPATATISKDGAYVWVVNFNLYGDMVPSSVSVVYTDGMVEVARIPTCTMPHGSRLNAAGTKHYSACMMDDLLVEIDAQKMQVARYFSVVKGAEHPVDAPMHGMRVAVSCSPTWAQPSPDGSMVWVACNKANDIVEIDVASWRMTRRLPAGDGVYNLAVTHDGRLLVGTNKRGQSVSIIDLATGTELAKVATTRKVASGVVISADDRYAFVSLEGIGSQPGTVDIIDLGTRQKVASVDVGPQAGGIDVWRMGR